MAQSCHHCGQPHEPFLTVCPITGGRLGSATYTVVDQDEALVGSVVAERYHVRDILGQGSTGTVFGTEHILFGRGAAMKVLRPRYSSLESVQRIFNEDVRPALSVSHPSLCEVFDMGTLPDGAPFFVMERLEGDTMGARLGRERFSTAAAVDVLMQLLAVIDVVHGHKRLLGDLRPQNLFLAHRRGCRPVLKVLDFGLTRLLPLERVKAEWDGLRAAVGANDASGLLSIPYYLSPERSRGEHDLGPSSDLFTVAAIGYEALSGQKAFAAPSWAGLMQQIERGQPTPLTTLRPDISEELNHLLMRTLSSKPQVRPQSARDMQDELRSIFEGARRGSAQMRVAPPSVIVDSSVHTPLRVVDREGGQAPGSFETIPGPLERPGDTSRPSRAHEQPAPDDSYEEETRTDQLLTLSAAERLQAGMVDEASAEHPIRTIRPPQGVSVDVDIDIDVDVEQDEPTTSRGGDLATVLGLPNRPLGDEEEETETMQLTPEVRARIEQMTKAAIATSAAHVAGSVDDSQRPPPTRRLTKPPRR